MQYMCHKWPRIHVCSVCRNHNAVFSSFITYHRVCNKSSTTGATCGAETAYHSGAPEFTPGFSWVHVARSLVFCVVYLNVTHFLHFASCCRSLFVLLSFFFWPLCCLFYFDIRVLIAPLVSSNFSSEDLLIFLNISSKVITLSLGL